MSLNFAVKGAVFHYDDDTSFHFKRASRLSITQWEMKKSVIGNRSKEEKLEFSKRASEGVSNWEYFSGEEKADIIAMSSEFCLDFVEDVKGLVNEDKEELIYKELSKAEKMRFWDEMQDVPKFVDWLVKYKAGGEKKSTSMA